MIGQTYWVWIWYGILLMGFFGLVPAIHWGRITRWRNLDELLRALGTIVVSIGMLLLLQGVWPALGYLLLVLALGLFVSAFVFGRRIEHDHPHSYHSED